MTTNIKDLEEALGQKHREGVFETSLRPGCLLEARAHCLARVTHFRTDIRGLFGARYMVEALPPYQERTL